MQKKLDKANLRIEKVPPRVKEPTPNNETPHESKNAEPTPVETPKKEKKQLEKKEGVDESDNEDDSDIEFRWEKNSDGSTDYLCESDSVIFIINTKHFEF
jgi:hypothetical protein